MAKVTLEEVIAAIESGDIPPGIRFGAFRRKLGIVWQILAESHELP